MTSKAGSQVAPLLPWIDHVLVFQPGWRGETGHGLFSLREDITLIEQLRSQQFSAAFIFTRVAQSSASAAYPSPGKGKPVWEYLLVGGKANHS